jgi:hypothetical protein
MPRVSRGELTLVMSAAGGARWYNLKMADPMTPRTVLGMLLAGGALYGLMSLAMAPQHAGDSSPPSTSPPSTSPPSTSPPSTSPPSTSPPLGAAAIGATPPGPVPLEDNRMPAIEDISQEPRSRGIGLLGRPPKGAAVFPDGTWLPPLNGVKEAPPFPGFGGRRRYAPVVRIHTDPKTGLQTYIHADGSASNTQLVKHTVGEESWLEPGWAVAHEVPNLPIVK